MEHLLQDLRFAARMLVKKPAFSLVVIATLALGIGANTAIFSVIQGVLLRPLPYPNSLQLTRVFETIQRTTMSSDRLEVAPANFLDWKSQAQSFAGLAAFSVTGSVIGGDGEAERLDGAIVTADFFKTLGVAPMLGRGFTVEDEQAAERLVIIGNQLWRRRFAGDPSIIGRKIDLDGFQFTVIGIAAPGVDYPRKTQIYELYRLGETQRRNREAHFLQTIARLKPGVTVAQAQGEMSELAKRLSEQYPQTNQNWGVRVASLLDDEVARVKPALLALMAAVGVVLLIACVNIASLLLARASSRRTEIGVRMALGAGRARILRQLLTESLLLAMLGGAAGLLVGDWLLELLVRLAPESLPRIADIRLDTSVLGFTLLLTLITGLIFGLGPAWNSAKLDINESLRASASRSTGRRRLFNLLVTAEIALTLTTLIGAGLLINSFLRVQRVDSGLDVDRLLTVSFEPPSAQYNYGDWRSLRLNYWKQLSTRVAAMPGVEAVAAIDSLPLSGRGRRYRFRKSEDPASGTAPTASFQVITPDYFRASGVRLLRGRVFGENDLENSPQVAVINQTMARQFWPAEDAVGKRIVIRNDELPTEIVGVVADVRHHGLESATDPEMYRPFNQVVIDVMPMVIRVKGQPLGLASNVRQAALAVDPRVAVERIVPMSELLTDSLAQRRFIMLLLGFFAVAALTLASVGVYGVMAFTVSERTREIGVRLALGATRKNIFSLILRQGLRLALAGLALGTPLAVAGAKAISGLLFEVRSTDLLTFGSVSALLALVTLVACFIPARRATRVDPMVALKSE